MKTEKEIVLEYVQGLKLTGVRDGLDDLCVLAAQEGWSPMRLVAELLRKETERRWELHVRTRMKAAKFPQLKPGRAERPVHLRAETACAGPRSQVREDAGHPAEQV